MKGENGEIIDQNRTFFCSELIAKAYKWLGIFKSNISCARIYPKHFSSKNTKKLKLEGAYLGIEKLVEN